jgi:capsule polysaccharide export protein KpsE/RkpR
VTDTVWKKSVSLEVSQIFNFSVLFCSILYFGLFASRMAMEFW